ncbi:uncharacterized protein PAC_18464 [Phialocephala subalpina]|uniref:Ig-like domain-containing protein n=1 Tax=Phialocephala subalpina TaxID=576137 RepID=A0A1L7XU66_9HELO|nr:uncharacterized protein PAC_18464 [Phialocephala subalpina]
MMNPRRWRRSKAASNAGNGESSVMRCQISAGNIPIVIKEWLTAVETQEGREYLPNLPNHQRRARAYNT